MKKMFTKYFQKKWFKDRFESPEEFMFYTIYTTLIPLAIILLCSGLFFISHEFHELNQLARQDILLQISEKLANGSIEETIILKNFK